MGDRYYLATFDLVVTEGDKLNTPKPVRLCDFWSEKRPNYYRPVKQCCILKSDKQCQHDAACL